MEEELKTLVYRLEESERGGRTGEVTGMNVDLTVEINGLRGRDTVGMRQPCVMVR